MVSPLRASFAVWIAAAGALATGGPAAAQTPTARSGAGSPAASSASAPAAQPAPDTLGLRTGLPAPIPVPGLDAPPAGGPPLSGAPNFRKPEKRLDPALRYAGRPKTPRNALPKLVPYPGAPRRFKEADVETLSPVYAAPAPIPRKLAPKPDTDPFGPLGIGVGSLRLYPYVEAVGGYDTNPDRAHVPNGGSATLRGEVGLRGASDWSRHSLTADLRAGYTDYVKDRLASRPDAAGKIVGRLDVTRDFILDGELRGTVETQRPGSPELNASVRSRPVVASFGTTAGGTVTFGRLQFGLHGLVDRTLYQDGTLTSGTVLPLSVGDFTAYGAVARVGYEVTPGVVPFVEVGADARRHDQALDGSGFARDSEGASVRAGTTFEFTRSLTGQIAGGYAQRRYADARLARLGGPTLDSQLVWAATPLTTLTLAATTTLDETTVANASGAIDRKVSLTVAHALRRDLTLTAIAAAQDVRYRGVAIDERTLSATLRADYALSRWLVLRAALTHERLRSSSAGSDYNATTMSLGVRLQP